MFRHYCCRFFFVLSPISTTFAIRVYIEEETEWNVRAILSYYTIHTQGTKEKEIKS